MLYTIQMAQNDYHRGLNSGLLVGILIGAPLGAVAATVLYAMLLG